MFWHKLPRLKAGGHWRCYVRKREVGNAWAQAKYDRDPLHRIGKNLHDHARRRRDTIERRKQAMTPTEGG
jgi:hypothetical protein